MRRPFTATWGLAVVLLVTSGASGGCEVLVSGEIGPFAPDAGDTGQTTQACDQSGAHDCPAGQYCKGAGCTACEKTDPCDGYDNDCDGIIDDGPLSDHDGDTYTFCGLPLDPATGKLQDVDCDDNDPSVHPNDPSNPRHSSAAIAKEVCDGKDNDCDGVADEPDQVCPPNQTCVPKQKTCIDNAEACTVTSCPPPKVCDTASQTCVSVNGGPGTACSGDKACTSGICADPSMLGNLAGVCTSPCCTSNDCTTGFICYGAGTGGNYCVKSDAAGRATPGNGEGGSPCSTGSNCRSGLCANTRCVDTCCSDSDCRNGTGCSIASVGGKVAFVCAPPPGSVPPNSNCGADGDCASGVCAQYTDGFNTYARCAATCCGSTHCGTFTVPGTLFTQPQQVPTVCFDDQRGGGTVPICDQPKQGQGSGAVGDPCQSNGDCLSDHCVNHLCTDVCCVDSDCGKQGWGCRPAQVGNGTVLRCQPL